MYRLSAWIAFCLLALTGCQAGIQRPAPDLKTPLPLPYDPLMLTAPAPPADNGQGMPLFPPGVAAAQTALAERLNLPLEAISVVQVEANQWPDGCLGLGAPEEVCPQQIVDGYYVLLQADGQYYEYRTDSLGTAVRELIQLGALPPAGEAARRALAELLLVQDPLQISVVDIQAVDWPDACLGIEQAESVCAQVITPGYRVILTHQGTRYEYHTDAEGQRVLAAGQPVGHLGQVLAILRRGDGTPNCQIAQVSASGAALGACGETLQTASFTSPQRAMELSELSAAFAAFSTETAYGRLAFYGNGSTQAGPAQQRAVAAWVWLTAQEAHSLLSSPQQGLLLSWRRSGGLAGLCDELLVYESGWAYASICREEPPQPYGQVRLDEQQLQTLFAWVDRLGVLQVTKRDDFADGFQYDLTLIGRGSAESEADAQAAMFILAEDLFTAAIP